MATAASLPQIVTASSWMCTRTSMMVMVMVIVMVMVTIHCILAASDGDN